MKGSVEIIISDEIAPDISPKMRMVRFIAWLLHVCGYVSILAQPTASGEGLVVTLLGDFELGSEKSLFRGTFPRGQV
jgi:hypothetical protein